jgi:hypothetical protein
MRCCTPWLLQVPKRNYELGFWMFFCVFVLDCLNAMFESRNTKLNFVLLPAFVKALAGFTTLLLWRGSATLALSSSGRV